MKYLSFQFQIVRKKDKCENWKWILRIIFVVCSSNINNDDLNFLAARSENGCEK